MPATHTSERIVGANSPAVTSVPARISPISTPTSQEPLIGGHYTPQATAATTNTNVSAENAEVTTMATITTKIREKRNENSDGDGSSSMVVHNSFGAKVFDSSSTNSPATPTIASTTPTMLSAPVPKQRSLYSICTTTTTTTTTTAAAAVPAASATANTTKNQTKEQEHQQQQQYSEVQQSSALTILTSLPFTTLLGSDSASALSSASTSVESEITTPLTTRLTSSDSTAQEVTAAATETVTMVERAHESEKLSDVQFSPRRTHTDVETTLARETHQPDIGNTRKYKQANSSNMDISTGGSSNCGTYASTQRQYHYSDTAMHSTVTAAAAAASTCPTTTGTVLLLSPQQQLQSHFKYEGEWTSPAAATVCTSYISTALPLDVEKTAVNSPTVTAASSTTLDSPTQFACSNVCGGGIGGIAGTSNSGGIGIPSKISNKLQNNQFIKNQQFVSGSSSTKYFRYKSHSVQEHIVVATAAQAQPSAGTGSPITGAGSPTKTASTNNASTVCAHKKKMVAVQEMKKTTQSSSHHHHHHHHPHYNHHHSQQQQMLVESSCARQNSQRQQSQIDTDAVGVDFDPSEDLSYGPGIVSKLRCRYLSLALRETMEKQRHCMDNLRRATSLNNLLDRDDHKDVDDDIDVEVEEHDNDMDGDDDDDSDLRADSERAAQEDDIGDGTKVRSRSLKYGNSAEATHWQHDRQDTSVLNRQTAIFQKHANSNASHMTAQSNNRKSNANTNGNTRMTVPQQSVIGAVTNAGGGRYGSGNAPTSDSPRSRHIKRGNDSLKRARSVEALLCDKTPWNFAMNRSSFDGVKNAATTDMRCVTIEDKINNARDRLISGTDSMPPKRLTSIIDDTERPPPDLVKQTLKMFEASANRRGRMPNRSNHNGDVANKIANYKSIIRENKPPILFPRPPPSPTKKLNSPQLAVRPAVKPVVAGVDHNGSPLGRKTTAASSGGNTSAPTTPTGLAVPDMHHMTSTPKHTPAGRTHSSERLTVGSSGLSENSPDIIPRHKLLTEKIEMARAAVVASPVTALTRKLEQLCIENDPKQANKQSTSTSKELQSAVDSPISSISKKLEKLRIDTADTKSPPTTKPSLINIQNVTTKEFHAKQQQHSSKLVVAAATAAVETDESSDNSDYVVECCVGRGSGAGGVTGGSGDAAIINDDKSDRAAASQSGVLLEADIAQAGTGETSCELSDDEYGLTKRVTRTALDNIAKAGTTLQFKFAGVATTKNTDASNINGDQITAGFTNDAQPNLEIPTSVLTASPGKQIGVIRPLPASSTSTAAAAAGLSIIENSVLIGHQSQQHQHMESLKQTSGYGCNLHSSSSSVASSSSSSYSMPLTSREIEKNRINEMKKTASVDSAANAALASATAATPIITAATAAAVVAATPASVTATSLDNVINTNASKLLAGIGHSASCSTSPSSSSSTASLTVNNASGLSELDAVTANNSPLWALRKKRQAPVAVAENTTMVFNFSNRKEVPDYIENDGVIFRRKRELPKPNESGFVLLGDLSVETSTESEYDDYSLCPPSPCDVEFENANIVIDGKSSIRQKPKEATFRVQFNDTLTSTFEYPSEASLIVEESFNDQCANSDDLVSAYKNMLALESDSPVRRHHHVAVDEIIPLPTTTEQQQQSADSNTNKTDAVNTTTAGNTTPSKNNILGNLPLGSMQLGFYTPVKAPIESLFQLGVTRAPNSNGHPYGSEKTIGGHLSSSSSSPSSSLITMAATATANGNGNSNGNDNSNNGNGESKLNGSSANEHHDHDSLADFYDGSTHPTVAYSEGTIKTDLLY